MTRLLYLNGLITKSNSRIARSNMTRQDKSQTSRAVTEVEFGTEVLEII